MFVAEQITSNRRPVSVDLTSEANAAFVAEFLRARNNGLLMDWTPEEYVARRRRDERRKQEGRN